MLYSNDRAENLRAFLIVLQETDVRNDDAFRNAVTDGQRLLELSDQDMADELSVSRPTVNRWTNGKNLPHIALRKSIATWLVKEFTGRIRMAARTAVQNYGAPSAHSMPMAAKNR